MKECDILGGEKYSDPLLHIFGGQDLPTPWSTPLGEQLIAVTRSKPTTTSRA